MEFSAEFLAQLKQLLKDDQDDKLKHEHYKACVEHAEEMSWHVYGTKPLRLLERTRPREDPAITRYRLDSYEPITQSICKKAISIVHKIFNPTLSSIRFHDDEKSKALEKYSMEEYPVFNSLKNYFANYVLRKMISDPNGVLLVQPYVYDIEASKRTQPIITCYHSKDIWLVDREYYLLFDKKVEVDNKGKTWFFTYVDKQVITKFSYQSVGDKVIVEEISSYAHNFNELPLWYLSGEYSDKNYGLFDSFFYAAVPFWNEAINDHSDVTGSYRMHMWPQKWEVADECEYVEMSDNGQRYACQGGWIFNPLEEKGKHKCPSCKGAGRKTATSPYESYLVNRDKFLNAEGSANIQVPFGYVTVPTDALDMLEKKANDNLNKGLVALNMDVVNEIGLNQSGKAKEMDRTELNEFLQRIADVMFEIHLTNAFWFFTKYMFGIETKEKIEGIEPEISKPTEFDIYSSTELTEQFTKAKTAKLNPMYLRTKQAQIQNKEFAQHPELLDTLNLSLKLDVLAETDRDSVSLMLSNGTITKETAVIHDNMGEFLARANEEYPGKEGDEKSGFCHMERKEQMDILDKYAKEVISANRIVFKTEAIEDQKIFSQQQPAPAA